MQHRKHRSKKARKFSYPSFWWIMFLLFDGCFFSPSPWLFLEYIRNDTVPANQVCVMVALFEGVRVVGISIYLPDVPTLRF